MGFSLGKLLKEMESQRRKLSPGAICAESPLIKPCVPAILSSSPQLTSGADAARCCGSGNDAPLLPLRLYEFQTARPVHQYLYGNCPCALDFSVCRREPVPSCPQL